MGDLRIIGVGRVEADPRWRMKRHSHSFHEIIVITRGIEHVAIRGQTLHAATGDVLFYPAGVAHEEWSDTQRPFESHFIAFEWKDCPPDLPLRVRDTKGRIRQIILWLYADRDSHSPQAPATQIAHLQTLLAEYRSAAERRDPEHELVAAIRGHIHDRIDEKITLGDLARRAGLSKYHFLRTYQALTRHTPMEEVRAIRLRRAQELILGTNLPLKEVAVRCGLGNEYLLSRLFRKHFNMPPGEMRRGRKQ